MNFPYGSSPDSAQQFAQHHRAHAGKNDHRPGFPHQGVDELVKLRMRHAHICSGFRAKHIHALRDIEPGEELSYDYALEIDEPITGKSKQVYECLCGSPHCRGTMLATSR